MASTQESSANPDRMLVSHLVAVRALRTPRQIENTDHRLAYLDAKLVGKSQVMDALKKSIDFLPAKEISCRCSYTRPCQRRLDLARLLLLHSLRRPYG